MKSSLSVRRRRFAVVGLFLFLLSASTALAQSEKVFSVPLDKLKTWSEKIVVSMDVTILGNSKVHKVAADCEMHFGATSASYSGDPDGLVLEPMNLCVEPFFGKNEQSDADWIEFAKKMKGAAKAEGVPRVWPEHLVGGHGDSNPNHALELHPVTKIEKGDETFDFAPFIYAPDGFPGGVKAKTAASILKGTTVSVTESGGMVEVNFVSGTIGNFTTLDVSFSNSAIQKVPGGHRFDGKAIVGTGAANRISVRLVTVAGSDIDADMEKLSKKKKRTYRIQVLALFSLSPEALHTAATQSNGNPVAVVKPIQLILFGVPEAEE